MINPAALLPGAVPSMAPSSSSGVSSSSLSPSPATTPIGAETGNEGAVSFDTPVQVTTLQSAHKVGFWLLEFFVCYLEFSYFSIAWISGVICEQKSFVMQSRVKGSAHRRPQSRAARQQAAQRSVEDREETLTRDVPGPNPSLSGLILPPIVKSPQMQPSPTLLNSAVPTALPASSPSQPSPSEISRPSVLTLPVSTDAEKKDSSKDSLTSKVLPSSDEDDLFGSDSLFATSIANKPSTRQTTKTAQPQASSGVGLKKDKDKSTLPSIFDDNTDDLFQKVKPKSATKKAKASSFLEEDDDDDEDIFGVSNSSTPSSTSSKEIKNSSSFSKQDIFQVLLFYIVVEESVICFISRLVD